MYSPIVQWRTQDTTHQNGRCTLYFYYIMNSNIPNQLQCLLPVSFV